MIKLFYCQFYFALKNSALKKFRNFEAFLTLLSNIFKYIFFSNLFEFIFESFKSSKKERKIHTHTQNECISAKFKF